MTLLVELGRRLVIAHRGASFEAPENTLPAFDLAHQYRADAIELDVRLSRDGVPVVVHDERVDRTTDRSGYVSAFSAAELGRMDAGYEFRPGIGSAVPASFPWRGRGVGVPTLAEVLDGVPRLPLLIELKEVASQQPVYDAIRSAGAEERCVLASDHDAALALFRRSGMFVCGSRRDVAQLWARAAFGLDAGALRYRALSVPVSYYGIPVATSRLLELAARIGVPIHVWTVDDPARTRRLWGLGAAGIVTNDPLRMVSERDRWSVDAREAPRA